MINTVFSLEPHKYKKGVKIVAVRDSLTGDLLATMTPHGYAMRILSRRSVLKSFQTDEIFTVDAMIEFTEQ